MKGNTSSNVFDILDYKLDCSYCVNYSIMM